jgi:hypothetical protein
VALISSPEVPVFVSEIIWEGLRPNAGGGPSFIAIIETLRENGFKIVEGVDSDAVSEFVARFESREQSGELESIPPRNEIDGRLPSGNERSCCSVA